MKYIKQKLKNSFDITDIITIHYFEFSKDFSFPPEKHDFWEIHYVDKGTAISVSNDKQIRLNSGEIMFHKPMSKHQILVDKSNVPNVCVISFSCSSNMMKFFEGKTFKLNPDQKLLLKSFLSEANDNFQLPFMQPTLNQLLKKKNSPPCGLQMLKIKLETLLIDLFRTKKQINATTKFVTFSEEYNDQLSNQIISYLASNLSEEINLDKLCSYFNYGKTYLCTHFKQITGKSIFEFLIELKINTAKEIIRKNNADTYVYTQIAFDLGYKTQSHFFHQFKKITGLTPSQYSQSIKQYDK